MVGWLVACLVDWYVGWLVDRFDGVGYVGYLVGWCGWLVGRSVGWLVG